MTTAAKMIVSASLSAAAGLALCATASAQQAACSHGASTVQIAGMDMDTMRCQLATAVETAGVLTGQNIAAMSQARMLASENDDLKKQVKTLSEQAEKLKAEKAKDQPKEEKR